MRVLFLNPPYLKNYLRSARCTFLPISGSNWYPIFLAYAAGWLLRHGHEVKLVDAPVADLGGEKVAKTVKMFQPDILVVYVSEPSLKNDIRIGKGLKKLTGAELVLVGPWCAWHPERILKMDGVVDVVVRREFDDVLLDLANGKKKRTIKGIVYRDRAKIVSNPERPFLTAKQLDSFPFVTSIYKKFLPMEKYFQASLLHPFVDLFTARGCVWNQCTFCLWPNTIHKGAMYRARSLTSVLAELKYIKKELPEVKEVFIQDDMLPAVRARQISELILKNRMRVNWSCYVKADVDFETLKLMKKAGCRYLHVGYETADETIIKKVRKGTSAEEMKRFTEDTKRAGLRVHGDFILGLPGETEETIKKTIKFAKSLGIEGYQVFVPQPHQATPLYDYLRRKRYLTKSGEIDYPHLSFEKLSFWRFRFMREIYFSPRYIWNTLKNISSWEELVRLARTARYVIPNIIFN